MFEMQVHVITNSPMII